MRVTYLPQFTSAVLTAETRFMVLFSVHYQSIHRINPPPTYSAKLRLRNSNLLERDSTLIVNLCIIQQEQHIFTAASQCNKKRLKDSCKTRIIIITCFIHTAINTLSVSRNCIFCSTSRGSGSCSAACWQSC